MLDLASMTNDDFCTPITPSPSRAAAQIVIDESGMVFLSHKLALKFSKRPVQLRLDKTRTAIQISYAESDTDPLSIIFPKSGRKSLPNASELLRKERIALPAVFCSYEPLDGEIWRGAYAENPTTSSPSASQTKKKK